MTDQPRSVASLRKLASAYPGEEALLRMLAVSPTDPNDRAIVLTVVSLLEGALQECIIPKLIMHEKLGQSDLFGSTAPLRAFSAKIKISFAIGLFGAKTREDLHTIREVRNNFAHSMSPLTFDTPEMAPVCKRVTLFERLGDIPGYSLDWAGTGARFILAASYLTLAFDHLARRGTLSPDKPAPEDEPMTEALAKVIAE